MRLTAKAWSDYADRLSRLNTKAGQLMRAYLERYGAENTSALISYASALVDKYGEGSAELACQMYDAMAKAAGLTLPAAEPAAPAAYGEVAKAVNGTKHSPALLQSAVSRLVKQAGADTTLQNAIRDGAEFAWIPHGDTCAFCLMLASRGWQKAGKRTLKNGHAEHIHANCDCEYAVRFNSSTTVAGYDPEQYLAAYESAEGRTYQEKLNSLRRAHYAENQKKITAQKRAAYLERQRRTTEKPLLLPQIASSTVMEKVEKGDYSLRLGRQQYDKHCAGTQRYDEYAASRAAAGRDPQSRLKISFEEAQKMIADYSGTGIIKVKRDSTASDVEFVTCETPVGEYFESGKWHETRRAAIHHGKKGSHIVPVKEDGHV